MSDRMDRPFVKTPVSLLVRPVKTQLLAGLHTGLAEYDCVKLTPLVLSRSSAGVCR